MNIKNPFQEGAKINVVNGSRYVLCKGNPLLRYKKSGAEPKTLGMVYFCEKNFKLKNYLQERSTSMIDKGIPNIIHLLKSKLVYEVFFRSSV